MGAVAIKWVWLTTVPVLLEPMQIEVTSQKRIESGSVHNRQLHPVAILLLAVLF